MPEGAFFWLLIVIAVAVMFDFSNGLNDAANAIATVVSTRVLSPMAAVVMGASLNVVGALSGTEVAKMLGSGIVDPSTVSQITVLAALISASAWVLVASYYGLPISASHALIASVVGAGVAMGGLDVLVAGGIQKVLMGLFFAPLLGFIIGMIVMVAIYWIFRRASPRSVGSLFKNLQILSAAFMAFSHGSNDAQKTMGIITMSLAIHYGWTDFNVPLWVILLAAGAMGLGTAIGGWRVIRTIGSRIVKLEPVHGFAAETSAATVIEVASRIGLPLSTTHVISSSIMGVGASRRISAVRWGVAGNLMIAWVVTLPACAVAGGLFSWLLHMAFA